MRGIGCGREQGEFRNSGNGCQRLAPKAFGGDRFQIVQTADFAGGVALQGNRHLLGWYAAAIVFNGNQAHAASHQAHRDLRCARVQRVV